MSGLLKKLMVVAALLLSATFAYAGDLKPAPNGGITPAPNGSKDNGMAQREENANDNASFKRDESDGDKDKVRKLRPVN